MIYNVINCVSFPIWKNDGKPVVSLNRVQKEAIKKFLEKIEKGELQYVNNACLCGNKDIIYDILIAEKDRYGIPCDIVLCKKCGLIRLRKRLNNNSTAIFYRDFYRDIYVGKHTATDDFFIEQLKRGENFFKFLKQHLEIDKINTVFEIGCGAGGILYPFFQNGKIVSGCDFGEKYLKYGRCKGLNLYDGEINEANTPKESVDLIILSHVMEHFNEPLKKLNEIIEFIKPEKFLLIEVPGVFWIPKVYFNPILYFQNAHVHNYYYYYLKIFFEKLGLRIIYGDERCTFILQKPKEWKREENVVIYDEKLGDWAKKMEIVLKKYYIIHRLKLNKYYYIKIISNFLEYIRLKDVVKKAIEKQWLR